MNLECETLKTAQIDAKMDLKIAQLQNKLTIQFLGFFVILIVLFVIFGIIIIGN